MVNMNERMPCSATAEELRTDAGTKPSGMPQAEMSFRDIAEAFIEDDDSDVFGLVERLLLLRRKAMTLPFGVEAMDHNRNIIKGIVALGDDVINHVEGL